MQSPVVVSLKNRELIKPASFLASSNNDAALPVSGADAFVAAADGAEVSGDGVLRAAGSAADEEEDEEDEDVLRAQLLKSISLKRREQVEVHFFFHFIQSFLYDSYILKFCYCVFFFFK
jgi:hypothetical protein